MTRFAAHHEERLLGFLRRLLGGGVRQPDQRSGWSPEQRPSWMHDGMEVQLREGREDLEVVGEASYQDNLWRIVGGHNSPNDRMRMEVYAVLVAEPDNPYDANAVSVWVQGLKVGYLSREDARRYQPGLLALEQQHGKPIALAGAIVGGGMRADGPGRLGVFLDHDPADFGLRPMAPPRSSGSAMRTGLSDAVVTDEADDSYDLSWMGDLPADDLRAIKMLRQLLEHESDAIDRHFMHAHLEALLYRSRDVFTSALDEYDQACRQHDAEMDGTRDAFMAKWGRLPVLETYRQMAIREQKAKNFEQALWWAERGIAIYGADCARPEAVEDLQKRADYFRGKLNPQPRPPRPRAVRSEQSEIEVLICGACGREFRRTRVRGRKPLHCPECRDQTA
jgi:tetratricopeptide (TPR) repeat protein